MTPADERRAHQAFRLSVILKALDALLEIAAAAALAVVDAKAVSGFVMRLAHKELVNHPADLIAGYVQHLAAGFSVSAKTFAVAYLGIHGIIKLVLAAGLLREQAWAFPVSVVAFGGFIAYQLYRFTFTHSGMLIALTVFDAIVLALIVNEWRQRAKSRQSP